MQSHAAKSRPQVLLDGMGDPLSLTRYDWREASLDPLSIEERYQLTYATQVEWATEGTFASLDIARDPIVKRFIRVWLEQERAHAQILGRLLDECAAPVSPLHTSQRQRFAAQRGRLVNALAVRAIGDDFYAVHMSWGAINELTTLRFYSLIRERTQHRLLREILRDLIKQEAQHFAFYYTSAQERLVDNPRGQRLVRWVLGHLWTPVGVGLRTREDVDRNTEQLFVGEPAEVAQIDAVIGRIPGLADLNLMRRNIERLTPSSAF